METCTCSLRRVLRNGSCSICPLLLIGELRACYSASLALDPWPDEGGSREVGGWVASLAACGGIRVGIDACLELYPKGRAPQLERVAEKMFQVAAIGVGHVRQRRPVDDDERRIDAALMGIAQLRPHVAGTRRLLSRHGELQRARESRRRQPCGGRRIRVIHRAQQCVDTLAFARRNVVLLGEREEGELAIEL